MPRPAKKTKLPPDPRNSKRVDPKLGYPPGYRSSWGPSKAMLRAIRARTTESRLLAQAQAALEQQKAPDEQVEWALAMLEVLATTSKHEPSRVGSLQAIVKYHAARAPKRLEHTGKDGGPIVVDSPLDEVLGRLARLAAEGEAREPPPDPLPH